MQNRSFKLLAVLCLLLIYLLPVSAFAENPGPYGGIDWEFIVTDEATGNGTLIISPTKGTPEINPNGNTGKRYAVGEWRERVNYNTSGGASSIGGAPYDLNKVTKLIIEEGVTKIGSFAVQMPNLKGEVVIPSTVTYIGQEAFHKTPIDKLTFAEGSQLKCIANGAFKKLNITEIVLPASIECIGVWILGGCEKLKEVTILGCSVKMKGSDHIDYNPRMSDQLRPSWANTSGILSGATALETVTLGDEKIRTLFLQGNARAGHDDGIIAYSGLTAYTNLQKAIDAAQEGNGVVTLTQSVEIKAGKTIVIPENVTLVIPKGMTLTNNGTIVNFGTVSGNGSLTNSDSANYAGDVSAIEDTVTYTNNKSPLGIYSLSYQLNGGTLAQENPAYYLSIYDEFTLNNPTKEDYIFKGWSGTGLDGDENKTVAIPNGSTGDRAYTANWTPITFDIVFDTNGGSGELDDVKIAKGKSFVLPECEIAPPQESVFKAWLVKGDFEVVRSSRAYGLFARAIAAENEQIVYPGDTIIVYGPIEITAVWGEMEKLPQTGDNNSLGFWFALLAVASMAMFVLRRRAHN